MKRFATRSIAGLCVAAGSLAVAVPAQATNTIGLSCDESKIASVRVPTPFYVNCAGPKDGVFDGSSANRADLQFFFGLSFVFEGFSDDEKNKEINNFDPNNLNGPFQNDPKEKEGVLIFDQPLFGQYVVALQGEIGMINGQVSSGYSYYLFDAGTTGSASLLYDTKGVPNSAGNAASPSLSFAGLFVQASPQAVPVPEPTGIALIAAACGALALTTRRRRN